MKKHLLAAMLMISVLAACKKKEPGQPNPKENPSFAAATFKYTGKMEVSEFVVYEGSPNGGKEASKNYTPDGIWDQRVKNFTPPEKLVFKSKDTLSQFPIRYEADVLKYKFSGDTLKGHNRYADLWEVYGIKTKKQLAYKMTFYVFRRVSPPYTSAAVSTEHGITLYKHMFQKGGANFGSPAEMLNPNDLVGWYNVSYLYEGDIEL